MVDLQLASAQRTGRVEGALWSFKGPGQLVIGPKAGRRVNTVGLMMMIMLDDHTPEEEPMS